MDPLLVLFDVDGTLVDTAGAGRRAMERAFLEVFGIDGISSQATGVRYAGMTDPVIIDAVAAALRLEAATFAAGRDALLEGYLRELAVEMARPHPRRRVLPGVAELLERLATIDRLHLGLLTGNIEQGARTKLAAFDLNRYFDDGGFASDHPDRAEIARIAHARMTERLGLRVPPSRTVVIGDTEHDVSCARANRFRAVAVSTGWVPRAELEAAGPDVLLDGFEDLAAALAAIGIDTDGRLPR